MNWRIELSISGTGKIMYQLGWVDLLPMIRDRKKQKRAQDFLLEHGAVLFDQQQPLPSPYPKSFKTPYLCVWVAHGDTIEWTAAHPFAVHFDPLSPADRIVLRGGGEDKPTCTILDDSPYGRYSCFVAVCKGGVVYTDDPDIIVDPRRTKGPQG